MLVGLDCVVSRILERIGQQFVHQTDAAAFLKLIDQDAGASLGYLIECAMKLGAAIASSGAENVSGQALRMDPCEGRFVCCQIAADEGNDALGFIGGLETKEPE